ncbi:U2 snRNP-associated protein Sf3b14 [Schizosaccharomyces japonicus yFS275]|uniref:U2 snRNP-associated protein Sf3b14 n=1 Tax=Schizosaccharomyces japonicus (strain yFS275 / FY16936) TaxID=402676 RepID=B6JVX4_SCHJY|nr:U2 snRNP-associated protein Sf3b14 [Schizosaccharomyces japonicus yFS275]EEB05525.1 U2 snRNP-associated protein Sf3b14 [Schizosaccharomyces japonicus yFS275]
MSKTIGPEVTRILFVKNLSFKVTRDDMYELFGRFGQIRQIRLGNAVNTKGTALVVYDTVADAKLACDKLSGYNFMDRYLVVHYWSPEKQKADGQDLAARYAALEEAKRKYGIH